MHGCKTILISSVDPCSKFSFSILRISSIEIVSWHVEKFWLLQDEFTNDFGRLIKVLLQREVDR